MNQFDAIIIGAGQAGPPLAERVATAGKKVALIERKLFGGTCINTGCTPTKTLVASAHAAQLARRGAQYGIIQNSPVRVDFHQVKDRMEKVVTDSRSRVERNLRAMKNCTVIEGQARFTGPKEIRVGEETLSAPQIFINVGARAAVPNFPGVTEVPFFTNSSLLAIDYLPKHLIIVGGSYVGLEFAQIFRRLGSRVTVVEKKSHLISREDEEISDAIKEILANEGIEIRTGAECIHFLAGGDNVKVGLSCPANEPDEVSGSHILLAVGRRPNTDDLDLDKAGVVIDKDGFIKVDDQLSTNVPGIWALGDCNRRGAFTHTAYNDFEIVAANLLDGEHRLVGQRILGYALYIDPPLGRVGMSEHEARKMGRPLLTNTIPMTEITRAIEKGETQGLMKITVDAETKKILGAAILGVGGDEAIHGILDMMNAGVTYDVLEHAVPIHPTVSELIPTMLDGLKLSSAQLRKAS